MLGLMELAIILGICLALVTVPAVMFFVVYAAVKSGERQAVKQKLVKQKL